jgi:hypothetical protein
MDVRGYPTGPIDAKSAFTSEIDLPPMIKPGPLNPLTAMARQSPQPLSSKAQAIR